MSVFTDVVIDNHRIDAYDSLLKAKKESNSSLSLTLLI